MQPSMSRLASKRLSPTPLLVGAGPKGQPPPMSDRGGQTGRQLLGAVVQLGEPADDLQGAGIDLVELTGQAGGAAVEAPRLLDRVRELVLRVRQVLAVMRGHRRGRELHLSQRE